MFGKYGYIAAFVIGFLLMTLGIVMTSIDEGILV